MARLLAFGLCTLFATGCMTVNHDACHTSLAPLPADEAAAVARSERNRVHVFILNGDDPFGRTSLGKLRDELNSAGYSQVSYGGLFFASLFESKIRKIHENDSEAKIILVGHGFGVATADRIAATLTEEGIALEGVIAISPKAVPGFASMPNESVRRVTITDEESTGTPLLGRDVVYRLDSTGGVIDDTAAAGVVLALVRESAASLPRSEGIVGAAMPLIDNPAPLPRSTPVQVKEPAKGILMSQPKGK